MEPRIAKLTMKNSKLIRTTLALSFLLFPSGQQITAQEASASTFLVKDGKPTSVIVAPTSPEPFMQEAIKELQYHLQRSSGVTLPVVDEKKAAQLPTETVRIVMDSTALPVETYRVRSDGRTLTFTGDGGKSAALRWAVNHYLDTQMGVRWLWPGEVGTYVPEHASIPLASIDHEGRPALETRSFRTSIDGKRSHEGSPVFLTKAEHRRVAEEAQDWLTRFQDGSRSSYKFGHAFKHWWDKYSTEHPEYFAVPPEGSDYKQPWPIPGRVKLRIGNPAVAQAIIAEWKAAGSPDNWNVSPNDSRGFDTSPESRVLDDPPNQDPNVIWSSAEANLTARYVKFWNGLIAEMRKTNPNVTLSSYAYSTYRLPPPPGLKVEPGIVLGFVHSFWSQDDWMKWQEAGAKLFLRPNWWHVGAMAPVIPLHDQGNYFKFAQERNMIGFDSDSLMGYWATQGPLYYTIARLTVRPELNVDEIIDEYTSAFGKAAPDIKKYLQYWEDFTTEANYPAATSSLDFATDSESGSVWKLIKEKKVSPRYLRHGWQVLPYVYTDDVLAQGYAILDQAQRNAASDNDYVKQRIQFLRDGLDHLKLTREVLELGFIEKRTPEQEEEYLKRDAQLRQLRHKLTLSHVLWGEVAYAAEKRRLAPTFSEKKIKKVDEVGKAIAEDG